MSVALPQVLGLSPKGEGPAVRNRQPGSRNRVSHGACCAVRLSFPQVLGLSPLDSFEQVKVAHRKKTKDAEARGDEAALQRVRGLAQRTDSLAQGTDSLA